MREWEIKPDITRGTEPPSAPSQQPTDKDVVIPPVEEELSQDKPPTRSSVPRVPPPTQTPRPRQPSAPIAQPQPASDQPRTDAAGAYTTPVPQSSAPTSPPTSESTVSGLPMSPPVEPVASETPVVPPIEPVVNPAPLIKQPLANSASTVEKPKPATGPVSETKPQPTTRPSTQPVNAPRQTAEEALSTLIERYHHGAISREQYQRDKQLLLARINPDAVTLKRAYRAPVAAGGEQEARFVRRVSFAQMAALVALVCVCILLVVGFLWWSSPIPTAENLLQQTGSPTKIPLQR